MSILLIFLFFLSSNLQKNQAQLNTGQNLYFLNVMDSSVSCSTATGLTVWMCVASLWPCNKLSTRPGLWPRLHPEKDGIGSSNSTVTKEFAFVGWTAQLASGWCPWEKRYQICLSDFENCGFKLHVVPAEEVRVDFLHFWGVHNRLETHIVVWKHWCGACCRMWERRNAFFVTGV